MWYHLCGLPTTTCHPKQLPHEIITILRSPRIKYADEQKKVLDNLAYAITYVPVPPCLANMTSQDPPEPIRHPTLRARQINRFSTGAFALRPPP